MQCLQINHHLLIVVIDLIIAACQSFIVRFNDAQFSRNLVLFGPSSQAVVNSPDSFTLRSGIFQKRCPWKKHVNACFSTARALPSALRAFFSFRRHGLAQTLVSVRFPELYNCASEKQSPQWAAAALPFLIQLQSCLSFSSSVHLAQEACRFRIRNEDLVTFVVVVQKLENSRVQWDEISVRTLVYADTKGKGADTYCIAL